MTQQKPIALVTGGAKRIGRKIACELARQGWCVAIHYRDSAKEAGELAQEIGGIAVQGELTEPETAKRLFDEINAARGVVTVLINNAATFKRDTLDTLTQESFEDNMRVNLLAPLLLAQAFKLQLGTAQGNIINLLDGGYGMSISDTFLSYTLSKQALAEATRLLAQALAPQIRVNAVAPVLPLPQPGEEAMFERLTQRLPLQAASNPAEIARSIAYILQTPSLSGHVIALTGGAPPL